MVIRKQETKIKKKNWYQIMAPKLFGEMVIGESISSDPNLLIGRTVDANLMHLAGDIKQQNISLKLRIGSIEEEKALTEPVSYEIGASSIRRFIRRNSERIDESFVCETADNRLVRVKPLFITVAKAKGSQISVLRKSARALIAKEIKKLGYENLLKQIINNRLQNNLKNNLKQILPLRTCAIRKLDLVKKEKVKKIIPADLKLELKKIEKEEKGNGKESEAISSQKADFSQKEGNG